MLPSFATQSVTRIRAGVKSVRGSDIPDWSDQDELVISGCSVQPATTGLSQDGRVLGILDGLTCYLPSGSDVREGDRIRFEGVLYMIDGAPRVWPSVASCAHTQVNLKRWSG